MVTDDAPESPTTDERLAQVAQYWQRCYDSRRSDAKLQLSRSLSATDTHISNEEDEGEEVIDIDIDGDDEELDDAEYEYRYVHYRRRSMRGASVVSGLPLVCDNCGVSFFSLQSVDNGQDECYCSGECKWSVIMYKDMERRMGAMRAAGRARANGLASTTTTTAATTYTRKNGSYVYASDDAIACH